MSIFFAVVDGGTAALTLRRARSRKMTGLPLTADWLHALEAQPVEVVRIGRKGLGRGLTFEKRTPQTPANLGLEGRLTDILADVL